MPAYFTDILLGFFFPFSGGRRTEGWVDNGSYRCSRRRRNKRGFSLSSLASLTSLCPLRIEFRSFAAGQLTDGRDGPYKQPFLVINVAIYIPDKLLGNLAVTISLLPKPHLNTPSAIIEHRNFSKSISKSALGRTSWLTSHSHCFHSLCKDDGEAKR